MQPEPTPAGIRAATERIADLTLRTPIVEAVGLGPRVGLKLESLQPTGSFKVRGAANRILALDDDERRRGVVTASTGNHGRAVAHIAATLGIPVTVCISRVVPPGKVAALRALGCEVVIDGDSQDHAMDNALTLVATRGMTLVHPFDDPSVICGQGTIGVEILEQRPGTDTVIVPLSGGGLSAGILLAVKDANPATRVVGVSMERAAAMAASLEAGRPIEMPERPTLADSLQGGIGLDNAHTFRIVAELMDEVVLLSESEIWAGMRHALAVQRLVLEGGAAVGIGALLAEKVSSNGEVVVVCTGANIEHRHLRDLVEELDVTSPATHRRH